MKVLDFGLAKVVETTNVSLETSPTLSVAQTAAGVILGTAAYMSPEQARGKSVDKRADIWAFGVVLYEMITGKRLFQGDTVSDTLAAVLTKDLEWDRVPAKARRQLRSCLQKDPRQRLADISDARLLLEENPESVPARRSWGPWTAAAIVLSAIIVGLAVWNVNHTLPPEPRQVTRLYYELPKDQQFSDLSERPFAVSPDGRHLVYCTSEGIYLRSLDDLDPKLIQGTWGNPQRPFFSPDGKWVGYWSAVDKQLKTQPKIVELVDQLLDNHVCSEIADILNKQGFHPGGSARKGREAVPFNTKLVRYIVHMYGLRARYDRLRDRGMMTGKEIAEHLGIHEQTLFHWAKHGIIKRHAYNCHYSLYEILGPGVPAKQCSRWNRLVDRAAAIRKAAKEEPQLTGLGLEEV